MLHKKVPFLYLVASTLLGIFLTFLFINGINKKNSADDATDTDTNKSQTTYTIQRLKGYKYISPIVSAEPVNEPEQYSQLKDEINNFIGKEKETGQISSVSVYVKDFNGGNWLAIDPGERYFPGSLLKVGVLMTYLHMAETNHDLLNSEHVYHVDKGFVFPVEHYQSKTVEEGHKYKIRELIEHMIRYSDNGATVFLENIMDTTIFKNEFSDLGITEPHFENPNYMLNAKEYSNMFKALYSASYLRKRASDTALALLTQTDFRQGLVKELPASVMVAHKFGEAGNNQIHELHESGIVYLDNNPYMITIMTRGTDWDRQSGIVSHISKMVYDKMVGSNDGNPSYHTTAAN